MNPNYHDIARQIVITYFDDVKEYELKGSMVNPLVTRIAFALNEVEVATNKKNRAEIEKLVSENNSLKRGENEWWRKRWVKGDVAEKLSEVRKKWLTAYKCAENFQAMYDQSKTDNKEIEVATAKRCAETARKALGHFGNNTNYENDISAAIRKEFNIE